MVIGNTYTNKIFTQSAKPIQEVYYARYNYNNGDIISAMRESHLL